MYDSSTILSICQSRSELLLVAVNHALDKLARISAGNSSRRLKITDKRSVNGRRTIKKAAAQIEPGLADNAPCYGRAGIRRAQVSG
jgi:hypothetical protein